MKTFFFLIVFSIITIITCKGQDSPWLKDIEYLSEQLPKKHIDFYKLIDSVDFKHEINKLKSIVDSLDDITIILELQKILASLNVSHTMIPIQGGLYSLPIKVEIFDDGLYIIGIDASKKEYLAKRIISMNNVSVQEIYDRLEPLISYENEYWLKNQIPEFIVKPQILEYLNIIDNANYMSIQLDNDEIFELPIKLANSEMIYCPIWTEMIWLKNQNKIYWYDTIDEGILYIQYNKCQEDKNYPFDKFVNDVGSTIDNNNIKIILIDLRLNSGGDSEIIQPLIRKLQEYNDKIFFAAISKKTFSSGRFAARDFKVNLNAKLIGEPTGGSPNSYGNTKQLILPNSGLPINYCVKYFSLMDTDKNYIEPDIRLEYNAKDLLEGKDLVLNYIKGINEP